MKPNYRIFFIFCVLSVLCFGCTKQKQQGLTITEGVLTVAVEVGYPPMEYYDAENQQLAGFDIELTEALADKLGLKAEYVDTAWEGILSSLDTGRCDIAVNITILPERQNNYNFTIPYIESSIVIAARKSSGYNIKKPEDLAGFSICYQSDTTAQYFIERLKKQGIDFNSYSYDKILYCFDDLELGRVDLVAVDKIAAFDYSEKENSPFEIVWQGPPDEYIAICLKKGNDALTLALNNALDELFEDGTILHISQKVFKGGWETRTVD